MLKTDQLGERDSLKPVNRKYRKRERATFLIVYIFQYNIIKNVLFCKNNKCYRKKRNEDN